MTALFAVIAPCPPIDALEQEWRLLEAEADPSVFLSWAWIGTHIDAFGPPSFLARVIRGDKTVGLALLGRRVAGLIGWPRRPSLHLNETGDPGRDGVMIEYNGVLTRDDPIETADAVLRAVLSKDAPFWRELHLGGVSCDWIEHCRRLGLTVRLQRQPQTAPFAALDCSGVDDPLVSLSRNTRQQLRRSLRWFERRGALAIRAAESADQAVAWLDDLEELHSASWRVRNKSGAFAAPDFSVFHRALIKRAFAEGVPDVLRVSAGTQVIGYLYNFVWREWAYSYQSGLRYEDDPDCRPGLVAHLLALRRYHAGGLRGYRFLAGNSRYKASFANGDDQLFWLVVHRSDWGHRLEDWGRRLRRALPSFRL
ncbi:GNAT family N-acetyltransferase [Azospirillaceae bacterium]